MTPVQKAEFLMKQFSSVQNWVGGEGYISIGQKSGRQCAIICVEQVIEVIDNLNAGTLPLMEIGEDENQWLSPSQYWKEVLSHIKNS